MLHVQAEPAKVTIGTPGMSVEVSSTANPEVGTQVEAEVVSIGMQVETEVVSTGTQVEAEVVRMATQVEPEANPEVMSIQVPTDDRRIILGKLSEV